MAFVRSSKPTVALCVLATNGLGVLEASKRSAWIFELGTILVCSAAARQVGPLGTDCGKLDVGLGHRLTPKSQNHRTSTSPNRRRYWECKGAAGPTS